MTDDLNKSVDVVADDNAAAWKETAERIVDEIPEHGSSDHLAVEIAKRLGYEYGRGYRVGVNQFQYACRILAHALVALKNGDTSQPIGDPTAEHFVSEAANARQVFLECKVTLDVQEPQA